VRSAVPAAYLPLGNDSLDTPNTAAAGQERAQIHRSREIKGKGKAPASELVDIDESILDADETDPEDYNIRSAERTELLIQLKGLFEDRPVSPALWACCQLCDKREHSALVDAAKINPSLLLVNEKPLAFIPLLCKLLVLSPYYSFDCRYAHS